MWIAKNNDTIILAKDTREELEEALKCVVYTSIEETNIPYELYNGEYLTPEEKQQKYREGIAQLSLTKREVFLALYKDKGITPEQIKAGLTNPEALIEFEYATEYFRGNPLIDLIGQSLGYTSEQLDYLFINGTLPE